ncbi:MAG: inosine/xanthosine triphosphatase [Nanoarchaeota archaeon]|nr:inosine/xanthosine triphosphatase [Nanoarchaeota archaeon]
MKIVIGSTNPTKIEAVKETISLYSFFKNAELAGVEAASEVSDQPMSRQEIMDGARNRARNAYHHIQCDYGIGLESGLDEFPFAGKMQYTACAIYDGQNYYFGISSAFKCPEAIDKIMAEEGINLNDACYKLGLTQNPQVAKSEGVSGVLTKNRKTRKDHTKDAIMMAMIHVELKINSKLEELK